MKPNRFNARTPQQVVRALARRADVFVPTGRGWQEVAYVLPNGAGVAVITPIERELKGRNGETIKPGDYLVNYRWENLDDEIER